MPRKRTTEAQSVDRASAAAAVAPARATRAKASVTSRKSIPPPASNGPGRDFSSDLLCLHDEIASLAYKYWEARGCPHGSESDDWFRAEQEVLARKGRGEI